MDLAPSDCAGEHQGERPSGSKAACMLCHHNHGRAAPLRVAAGALTAAGLAGFPHSAPAASSGPTMTPDEALERLMAGNKKFMAGSLVAAQAVAERRADVAGSGCSR